MPQISKTFSLPEHIARLIEARASAESRTHSMVLLRALRAEFVDEAVAAAADRDTDASQADGEVA